MKLKQKLPYFLISFIATFIILRGYLYLFPFTNFNLWSYNIHHLFAGALLLIIVIIVMIYGLITKFTLILAGIGSSLITDEFVYLLATDGSDLAYLSPISLWGAVIINIIILSSIGGVYYATNKNQVQKRE